MSAIERWAFLPDELDNLEQCRADDEFVVSPAELELGIIVYCNGQVSNRWEDGTVGIPERIRELADSEDEYYVRHGEQAEWRDVEVSEDGRPLRLCEVTP